MGGWTDGVGFLEFIGTLLGLPDVPADKCHAREFGWMIAIGAWIRRRRSMKRSGAEFACLAVPTSPLASFYRAGFPFSGFCGRSLSLGGDPFVLACLVRIGNGYTSSTSPTCVLMGEQMRLILEDALLRSLPLRSSPLSVPHVFLSRAPPQAGEWPRITLVGEVVNLFDENIDRLRLTLRLAATIGAKASFKKLNKKIHPQRRHF